MMDRENHCSCIKEENCFGYAGWHWLVVDEAWVERRTAERMPGDSDGQLEQYLRHGQDEDRRQSARFLLAARKEYREQQRHYIGTEWAYERCEAWTKAYEKKRQAERAKRNDETVDGSTGTRPRR